MKLNPEIQSILEKIQFISRYEDLSENHRHELSECLSNYDVDKVIDLVSERGYNAKFNKKEGFFKIVEKQGNIKYQFNISLKYGVCEFIWAMWIDGNIERLGPWTMIQRLLDNSYPTIKLPGFISYEELDEILLNVLNLYQDFKTEVQSNLEKI